MPPKKQDVSKSKGKKGTTEAVPPPPPPEPEAEPPAATVSPDTTGQEKKKRSSEDFDFSDFDQELKELTGGEGQAGEGAKWEKMMEDVLKDADVVADQDAEEGSDEEDEDEEEQDSDISSVPEELFVYAPSDASSEASEGAVERRYLLDRHSFMHLKDPGLQDALILKEIPPEKVYHGIQEEKHDYKKLCKELGVQPLNKFLKNMHSEELDLSWYGMTAKEIVAICKMLCNNIYVRRLTLRGNVAGQEGGDAIAEMIENNYTITHLDIARTEILPSMKKICEAVTMNIALESLDISRNELTSKEMSFVRDFLKETSTLRELFLNRNFIEDPGIIFLSKGIAANESLEILDLGYNRLRGKKNTFPFFDAISNHPVLVSLELFGNSLGDESARGIARILLNNSNFQYMNVADNRLTKAVCGRLGKSLAKSMSMTTFIAGPNLWTQGHMTQQALVPMIQPLTNLKNEVPLELLDLCYITPIYKQFNKVKLRVEKLRPDLKILVGEHFGLCKGKKPDVQALVIRRAKIVHENFATPLEMLIDELRTEPNTMTQREFKKFIKSCNLYKDKVMTKSFMENFPIKIMDVDCEAIIAAYDKEYPKQVDQKTRKESEAEAGKSGSDGQLFNREKDTDIQAMMKW